MNTFIYALCEPGTRRVRYIGKTDKPKKRLGQHLRVSSKKRTHLGNWLRALISCGEKPDMVVLREVPFEQWEIAEERYIRLARGCGMNLVNSTDGGEGITMTTEICEKIAASKIGKKASLETRKRMSKPKSPEHRANLKLAFSSPETFARRSVANSGTRNPQFGKCVSEETREKLFKVWENKTLEQRETLSAKISAKMMGRPVSPETRAKISARSLGQVMSPEAKAKMSKAKKGFCRGLYGDFKRLPLFSDGGGI